MSYNRQKGYIGITTIVIISVITLAITISAATLGTNELLYSYGEETSAEVLQRADGCADEAAYRLKLDPTYTGGTIPYNANTCTVSVSGSGSTRTITSTVTVGDFTRTVTVGVTLLSNAAANAKGIDVTSWSE